MDAVGYTCEAEALFHRFADKHGLTYEVDTSVPMEVCWHFPVQPNLSLPLTLGLQNADELNFGVWDFWSYFFPFEMVEQRFEHILDAWIAGDARVAVLRGRARLLQLREGEEWKTVYWANGILFLLRRFPRAIIRNGDTEGELEERGITRNWDVTPPWSCFAVVVVAATLLSLFVTSIRAPLIGIGVALLILWPVGLLAKRRAERVDYRAR